MDRVADKPYTLHLGHATRSGDLRWLKKDSYRTLEQARAVAERHLHRHHWIAQAKIEGPDVELLLP